MKDLAKACFIISTGIYTVDSPNLNDQFRRIASSSEATIVLQYIVLLSSLPSFVEWVSDYTIQVEWTMGTCRNCCQRSHISSRGYYHGRRLNPRDTKYHNMSSSCQK